MEYKTIGMPISVESIDAKLAVFSREDSTAFRILATTSEGQFVSQELVSFDATNKLAFDGEDVISFANIDSDNSTIDTSVIVDLMDQGGFMGVYIEEIQTHIDSISE